MQGLDDQYVASLTASLDRVLALMSDFSAVCPLMGLSLSFYIRTSNVLRSRMCLSNSYPDCAGQGCAGRHLEAGR